MATQYTAGLTSGQVLTAATMNSIGAAWETWTPTVTQGTTTFGISVVSGSARYTRIQKLVIAKAYIQITSGTGQLSTPLRISLPINNNGIDGAFGNAWIYDSSIATAYHAIALWWNTSSVAFAGDWSGGGTFGTNPATQATTNDYINALMIYEAA